LYFYSYIVTEATRGIPLVFWEKKLWLGKTLFGKEYGRMNHFFILYHEEDESLLPRNRRKLGVSIAWDQLSYSRDTMSPAFGALHFSWAAQS
jgi:hypothetical protein